MWDSPLFNRAVLCIDRTLQDLDTGQTLMRLDSDDAIEDAWEDYKASLADVFEGM